MFSFLWNAVAGRYYNATTGRFVSAAEVAQGVDALAADTADIMAGLTDSMIAGDLSVAEWQSQMMTLIRDGNRASAIAARGGIAQMSQADWGSVGAANREQYKYLQRFADQIASGKQPLNGSARTRAKMYASAIRTQFEKFARRVAQVYLGAEEERRVLGNAEHCRSSDDKMGCEEIADMGWQRIGKLPPIGAAPCLTNCKCHFVYRKRKGLKWVIFGR